MSDATRFDADLSVLELLEHVGALIGNSHIVYTSGKHGSSYVNKDALYPHVQITSHVAYRMATPFGAAGVEVVAGPTIGGVILAQWVAYHLTQLGTPVLAIYAEEQLDAAGTKQRVFRRGYDQHLPNKRVLIVEDILTTGQSARAVVDAVVAGGGIPIGVAALCNRGSVTAEQLGVPRLVALTNLALEAWDAATCPLCAAGVPINTSVGKGAAFLAQQAAARC